MEEYGLTSSALDRWIKQAQTSGSFKEKDNRFARGERINRFAKRTPASENGERYFKASRADHGTKVAIIQNNRDKYSGSAMCDVLQIARSTFYYEAKEQRKEDTLTGAIVGILHKNRKAYGTRKIKAKL